MRNTLLFLFLLYVVSGLAQPIYPWDDHIFPFCTDENPYGITYKSGTTGFAAFPKSTNVGCLGTTPGPIWYYMQIDQPGDLLIYIEQHASISHILIDVDFACWGPFQAESKRDFLNKLKNAYQLEVGGRPNHRPENGDHSHDMGGYPYNNLVDCSYDPAGTEWCYIPNAKSGEWYLLMITNFSQKPGKIHFERVNDKSTATTRCDVTVPLTINPVPRDLKQIDDHTSAICMDETQALVTIALEPDEGFTLSEKSLQKTKVDVFANGKTYPATLKDGHFECVIDINRDTTAYYALVNCPDPDFELQTEKHYLVKSTDCIPSQLFVRTLDTIHAGDIQFADLKLGVNPIKVEFPDSADYQNINIEDYNIEVVYDNPFIESVTVTKTGKVLKLIPKLRGNWCGCFMPDSLTFQLKLTPKDGNSEAKPYKIPVILGVEHQSIWIIRCLWVLLTIVGLLLILFYLRALLKKNRFHKNARLKNSYVVDGSPKETQKDGRPMREDGFGPWFNRWFNPFVDEKNTIKFTRPKTPSMTFTASESKNKILLSEACFDSKKMTIPGYTPPPKDQDKKTTTMSKPIDISTGTAIEIKKSQSGTTTRLGHLTYSVEGKDDIGGYRFFIGLLIIVILCFLGVLVFILIKSLF